MADYWVDDGGPALPTADGTSWATAYRSIADLISEVAGALTTSGNRIFIGDDHVEPNVAANKTYTGPASGQPVYLISCDRTDTSATPAYKAASGASLSSLGGAYVLNIDGCFALIGLNVKSGSYIFLKGDTDEIFYMENVKMFPAAAQKIIMGDSTRFHALNLAVDLVADSGATAEMVFDGGQSTFECNGLTVLNGGNRSGSIFGADYGPAHLRIAGGDVSSVSTAGAEICSYLAPSSNFSTFSNMRTAASMGMLSAAYLYYPAAEAIFVNCGSADDPTQMAHALNTGNCSSSTSVYRTSGATVETGAVSWLVVTHTTCYEGRPYFTPWIYGTTTNGTKTFTVYIENTTADFTNAEAWLEIQVLGTADEADWVTYTDKRVQPAAAVAQADDTGSTWNGENLTYKQSLSVSSVTVGESGQYRARACFGINNMAASRKCYVDPLVTVS